MMTREEQQRIVNDCAPGYEACSREEADTSNGWSRLRRGLYLSTLQENPWQYGYWIDDPDDIREGRLIWLRKVAKPQPRRWSSPDGKVVYEEVERFDDADYAGVFGGEVIRAHLMADKNGWYVHAVSNGSYTDKWVRRVFGGER